MYALRRRLDDGPQAGLAVPERVLRAFALVYVDVQGLPTENGPAGVPKGKPTNLKPTIRAVEASEARLEVIWLTRCDRVGEELDDAREVIWVNRIAGPPLLQFLECPTAVFEECVVDEVDAARRCENSDEARNAGQDQSGIRDALVELLRDSLLFAHGAVRRPSTCTPTGCVRLTAVVHETLVLGPCRHLRPMDSQRAILCNSQRSATMGMI